MESTTIAVDLAKTVFQVAVSRRPGQVALERRLGRARLLPFFAQQPPSTVLLEACGSAHHWARELQQLGHTVRLLPAHDVHRYVRRNKTDRTDAKALLEAHRNEEIHPVPVKSVDQQALTALHRLRATWLATRTARLNTLRGVLRAFGVVIPTGAHPVVPVLRQLAQNPRVPTALHASAQAAADDIVRLEHALHDLEHRLEALATQLPDVAWLRTIPGVGVITATALVGSVGCPRRFPSGRHFAS
jgi:transposase